MSLHDLWWLPDGTREDDLLLKVAHQDPISRNFDVEEEAYPIPAVPAWRLERSNTNVFRSVLLYDDNLKPVFEGPFYLDIDCVEGSIDLDDAAKVTTTVVESLLGWNVEQKDLRILFSGHKGFNVEVRPEALGVRSSYGSGNQVGWAKARRRIIAAVQQSASFERRNPINVVSSKGTVIDRIHGHLRLVGSKNAWIDDSGKTRTATKSVISIDELRFCDWNAFSG